MGFSLFNLLVFLLKVKKHKKNLLFYYLLKTKKIKSYGRFSFFNDRQRDRPEPFFLNGVVVRKKQTVMFGVDTPRYPNGEETGSDVLLHSTVFLASLLDSNRVLVGLVGRQKRPWD